MSKMTVNEKRCKGCGLCITACPKKIIQISKEKLNEKGYYPARCIEMDKCIGCGMCALMCPEIAITVER